MGDVFYRYEDYLIAIPTGFEDERYCSICQVRLLEFPVVSRTECGVWLETDIVGNRRFVLLTGKKRYASPTVEEARLSFVARKKAQIRHLRYQLNHAETALSLKQLPEEKNNV